MPIMRERSWPSGIYRLSIFSYDFNTRGRDKDKRVFIVSRLSFILPQMRLTGSVIKCPSLNDALLA